MTKELFSKLLRQHLKMNGEYPKTFNKHWNNYRIYPQLQIANLGNIQQP